MFKASLTTALACTSLFFAAGSAQAATWSKTSTTAGSTCNTVNGASCTIKNSAADASNATVYGYATTGSGGAWAAATLTDQGGSGFGLSAAGEASGSPNHAIDNKPVTEALVLKFDQSTALSQVTLGWWSSDMDITVLRYTGSGNPALAANMDDWGISGSTLAGATNTGWTLVGNYGKSVANGSTTPTQSTDNAGRNSSGTPTNCSSSGTYACSQTIGINADGASSSYWLVMAYNSAFGSTSANGGLLSNGNDYFKLLSVSGATKIEVPEPGALALAGLGLFGVFLARRRRA